MAKGAGISIGLFKTVQPDDDLKSLPTYSTASPTETGHPRRSVLVAHLLATLTTNENISTNDESVPPGWPLATPGAEAQKGHNPEGRTVAVHNFAVLPQLRSTGIGTILLKSYVPMLKTVKIYRRVAIAVPPSLVGWFERLDFETVGTSEIKGANGEERVDMVGH